MAGLAKRLEAISKKFKQDAPPEVVAVMHRATSQLAEELERHPGLGVGDTAPSFRLPDQHGNDVDSAALLAEGPLVLALFRGHW